MSDLGYLLKEYLSEDDLRRWDDPRLGDVDFEQQSAQALGIDVGAICLPNHLQIVRSFVARVEDPDSAAFHLLSAAASAAGEGRGRVFAQQLQHLLYGVAMSESPGRTTL